MEAAVALGVVSSVIAIAQLAAKVTITTGKLINSAGDALPENEWIEEVAQNNRDLAADLDQTSKVAGPLSKIDSAVASLARRCLEESVALTALLIKLKIPLRSDGTKSKWRTARAVCKSMLRHGELEGRHKKLVGLERQLAALLLHAIRTSQLEGFAELRDLVERSGRDCVTVVRDSQTALAEKLRALQLGVSTIEQGIGRVEQRQLDARERERVEDLFKSLAYGGMDSRKDMIADPTGSSYDWAFEDYKQPTKQWLESSVEHCWISGEPGTGKSVFTKSFRLDRRTITALQARTPNDNLLILDHYFWIAGDAHQRSFRALLQHLCYQAIQQYSVLAEVAFPDEWQSRIPMRGMSWTTNTLIAALKRISATSGFQTCIIIDGLDECEDIQRSELIRMLLDFSKTTNVRFCVSSRPWSDFEKAFDDWARLKLPENNAWDIFQLICRRLHLVDSATSRDAVEDVRLFEILSVGDRVMGTFEHQRDFDSLNPTQRLIRALFMKANGNVLWVTAVLDPICERLANGQSVPEVMKHLDDIPSDVEEYYHNLVYNRIHSTYRKGKTSECAMALKLVNVVSGNSCYPERQRFEVIWALLTSISAGNGLAFDSEFATQPLTTGTAMPLNWKAYQAVSAFVDSRLKDLLVAHGDSNRSEGTVQYQHRVIYDCEGTVQYRHRVIYDFLSSEKMRSAVDAAVPEHFSTLHFGSQLSLLMARQMYERDIHATRFPLKDNAQTSVGSIAGPILFESIQEAYDSSAISLPDNRSLRMRDDLARAIFRQVRLVRDGSLKSMGTTKKSYGYSYDFLAVMIYLVALRQFGFMADLIRCGYEMHSDHVGLAHVKNEEPLHAGCWLGLGPKEVRWKVPSREPNDTIVKSESTMPCYLPCVHTWWTYFLLRFSHRPRDPDVWSHAGSYIAKAFVESGASIDVEICFGRSQCPGHICVCPDSATHQKLYECPEPRKEGVYSHTHKWVSAKTILSNHLMIPEPELLQIAQENRNDRSGPEADLVKLARNTEAVWQRHVDACVRNKIQVLDEYCAYSWSEEPKLWTGEI